MPAPDGAATLGAALGYLARAGVTVADIGIRRPSLDEVFIALTGGTDGAEPRPASTEPESGNIPARSTR